MTQLLRRSGRVGIVLAAFAVGVGGIAGIGAQERIRWEPYLLRGPGETQDSARLGRLTVPARHDAPGDDSVEIAFVVLPARTQATLPPLVYLDGGPGGDGVSTARIPSFYAIFDQARENRDVVLLGQRGTRMADPFLACRLTSPLSGNVFRSREDMLHNLDPGVRECVATWSRRGVDLAAFTSWESAGDIDELRRALGAERVALVAFSYGTHLALTYMSRYPDGLDRAVLLGTEGLDETYRLPSTFDSTPPEPVSVREGKKAARARPMRSFAAASAC